MLMLLKNGYLIVRTTEWYFPYGPTSSHRLNILWTPKWLIIHIL